MTDLGLDDPILAKLNELRRQLRRLLGAAMEHKQVVDMFDAFEVSTRKQAQAWVAELLGYLDAESGRREAAERKAGDAARNADHLEGQLEDSEREKQELRERLAARVKENADLKDENADLKDENHHLKERLLESADEIEDARCDRDEQVGARVAQLEAVRWELESLKRKLDERE
jgi:chromosome segregation ATPase